MKQFVANRLSEGNKIFPAELTIDEYGVTGKIPGLLGGREASFPYSSIFSVQINTPLVGFCTVKLKVAGHGLQTIHGFTKEEAIEMKEMIQAGISGGGFSGGGGSGSGQSFASKAQSEVELKKLELEEQKLRHEKEARDEAGRLQKAEKYREKGQNFIAWMIELNPIYVFAIILTFFVLCCAPRFKVQIFGYLGFATLAFLVIKDLVKKQ